MKYKMKVNIFRDENMKLKTWVQAFESEFIKKERFIDDLLNSQNEGGPISK